MPTADELARAFAQAINRQDAAALGRLARAYVSLYERMRDKLDSLLLEMGKLEEPTRGQVMRLSQYKSLVSALEDEMTRFGIYTETEINMNMKASIAESVKRMEAYLKAAGVNAPHSLPANTIYNILGYLSEDSELTKKLRGYAGESTQYVADKLLEGVAFGYNPAKTAKSFQKAMGVPLSTAMRYATTAQMYASREANRAMYIANSDVVTGWMWWSTLSPNTCMACLAMHGKVFPNETPMESHYSCHCTSIPQVKWFSDDDVEETGAEWFSKLPAEQQKAMMGAETWKAWKDGLFSFDDLATRRHDDVWGDMLARTPLWEMLGAEPPVQTN